MSMVDVMVPNMCMYTVPLHFPKQIAKKPSTSERTVLKREPLRFIHTEQLCSGDRNIDVRHL